MEAPRHCIRPTCGARAEATLRYDYGQRTAWLADSEPDPAPGVWPLCAAHADTLRVPEGWELIDERRSFLLSYLPPLAG